MSRAIDDTCSTRGNAFPSNIKEEKSLGLESD